jgi:bifunctional non-homologous end joining protein LigD
LLPYRIRLARLIDLLLLTRSDYKHIRLVETAFSTQQKTGLWERLRRENREGIVFKRLDAPYVSGKPNQGGPQLKFKFVATLSVVVAKINTQRSVEVGLFQGRSLVSCGNVTIRPTTKFPKSAQSWKCGISTPTGTALRCISRFISARVMMLMLANAWCHN